MRDGLQSEAVLVVAYCPDASCSGMYNAISGLGGSRVSWIAVPTFALRIAATLPYWMYTFGSRICLSLLTDARVNGDTFTLRTRLLPRGCRQESPGSLHNAIFRCEGWYSKTPSNTAAGCSFSQAGVCFTDRKLAGVRAYREWMSIRVTAADNLEQAIITHRRGMPR
ncbi:hypothetical protein Moror_1141 [Moniliophthora roreri MCA 2997]|uniref:Uncharacterized protein n=1 Tax=Moniliophthora roreri (strain MCA 2997) TaxID=1381753 RepID=V2WWF6_MONRO|nr:hypothetical protein Moror_1141 [Moniliophthora roreri MCA 2997]